MLKYLTYLIYTDSYIRNFEKDIINTAAGDLELIFLGHGSMMFIFNSKIIYIDPYSKIADYSNLPKADFILITHHHQDHLDESALKHILKSDTKIILTEICQKTVTGGIIMKNGDTQDMNIFTVKAVPAYNINQKRENGEPFHIKGEGNGYVLAFGDIKVYIAGDTEIIPEMKDFGKIDIAFLPMNLPYTMSPEMAAAAVKTINPEIVYPCHFGETDTSRIVKLLKDFKETEIRIRRMK